MDDKALFDALVSQGSLKRESADLLLREAQSIKRRPEDLLYSRRLVDDGEVARLKSSLLKIPYKKVDVEAVTAEVLKSIPGETARTYRIVPIARSQDLLIAGMLNPDDNAAREALRFLAKQQKINLGVYVVSASDVESVLKKYFLFGEDIAAALQSMNLKPGEGLTDIQRIVKLEEGMTENDKAPVIRIVSSLLKEAVNIGASDIHIEPGRSKLRVRFRIDGGLREVSSLPVELQQPIISRVKVLSSLKLDETRMPQDGRFRSIIFDREIDFRVATFPTPNGEKVALRVLDPTTGLKSLDDLGVAGRNLEILKAGLAKPYGAVLLTGPTGSGKTTTLYALMQILNKQDVNIVSLEDPVEYTLDGVNQSQVKPEIGYDFASGLREILRQDPDIIMVGEIRDKETAELSVHAALTGHIVLATLHTNSAAGVIPRLVDMGVEPFLLPSAVNLMAAQRLVGRLCSKCRKAEDPSPQLLEIIKTELKLIPPEAVADLATPYKIYHAPGCSSCGGKGIVGRIAIFEVFQMTPQLADILNSGINENKILEEMRRQKTVFLRSDGILKALQGMVAIEDVLKETKES